MPPVINALIQGGAPGLETSVRVTLAGKTVINDLDPEYHANTSFQREVAIQ